MELLDINPKRCPECGWVVKSHNDDKCLNRECSLRNVVELKRIEIYEETEEQPATKDIA